MYRILLVKPTYKPTWDIPSGIVEQNESPKECCQREVQEEIGLIRKIGSLLVVDYNQAREWKTESLMFIFDGGVLSPSEIDSIELNPSELCEYRFFDYDDLPKEMMASLRARVLTSWQQKTTNRGIYLENQSCV